MGSCVPTRSTPVLCASVTGSVLGKHECCGVLTCPVVLRRAVVVLRGGQHWCCGSGCAGRVLWVGQHWDCEARPYVISNSI